MARGTMQSARILHVVKGIKQPLCCLRQYIAVWKRLIASKVTITVHGMNIHLLPKPNPFASLQ